MADEETATLAPASASDALSNAPVPMLDSAGTSDAPPMLDTRSASDVLGQPPEPQTTPAHQDPEMVVGAHHQNWLAHVMDTVGSILGGDTTLHVTKHPDGTVTVDHDPSTGGEKWGRIAAAALGGAAHGISVGQGPGGPARATAAGIGTGLQQPQQRLDEANKEASVEQLRMQAHANLVHTQQTSVAQAFANKMNDVAATQAQIDQANSEEERFKNAPGAEEMGHYASMEEVAKSPNVALIMQHHPNGTMRTVPTFDGKHNITGVRAYVVDKGWGDQLTDHPITYLEAKASETAGGDPTFVKRTIPKGAHTNAQADTILNAANAASLKLNADVQKAAETAEQKRQAEADRAEARRESHMDRQEMIQLRREQAGGLAGVSSVATAAATARQNGTVEDALNAIPIGNRATIKGIGEGRSAPPNRFTKEGKATMDAVNAVYPDYDSTRYKAYQDTRTRFTSGKEGDGLNFILTARNHLDRMAANIPPNVTIPMGVGSVVNWAKNKANRSTDEHLNAFFDDIAAVSGEVAKAYKGGVITEKEHERIIELLNSSDSPKAIRASINEFNELLKGKVSSYRAQWDSGMPSGVVSPNTLLERAEASIGGAGQQQQQQQPTFTAAPKQPANPPHPGDVYGTGPQGLGWYPAGAGGGR